MKPSEYWERSPQIHISRIVVITFGVRIWRIFGNCMALRWNLFLLLKMRWNCSGIFNTRGWKWKSLEWNYKGAILINVGKMVWFPTYGHNDQSGSESQSSRTGTLFRGNKKFTACPIRKLNVTTNMVPADMTHYRLEHFRLISHGFYRLHWMLPLVCFQTTCFANRFSTSVVACLAARTTPTLSIVNSKLRTFFRILVLINVLD